MQIKKFTEPQIVSIMEMYVDRLVNVHGSAETNFNWTIPDAAERFKEDKHVVRFYIMTNRNHRGPTYYMAFQTHGDMPYELLFEPDEEFPPDYTVDEATRELALRIFYSTLYDRIFECEGLGYEREKIYDMIENPKTEYWCSWDGYAFWAGDGLDIGS